VVARRTWNSVPEDRLFGHAAELGFYFFFAVFPALLCASAVLGLAARSAHQIYDRLLGNLALVIPTAALGTVVDTFNETTAAASSGTAMIGFIVALWSASAGISAIQDTLNGVYKVQDSRSYFTARIHAIGLTVLFAVIVSLGLASLFGGDYFANLVLSRIPNSLMRTLAAFGAKCIGWAVALALLALSFEVIYYWAPGCRTKRWHWLTPGGTVGILGWLAASFGLRIYLHYFNSFTMTYGSLGAVIILLTWFYITGLMILLGAEINSQIEAAAAEILLSAEDVSSSSEQDENQQVG
jgi:membrane protein